jgi:hypothetical protein
MLVCEDYDYSQFRYRVTTQIRFISFQFSSRIRGLLVEAYSTCGWYGMLRGFERTYMLGSQHCQCLEFGREPPSPCAPSSLGSWFRRAFGGRCASTRFGWCNCVLGTFVRHVSKISSVPSMSECNPRMSLEVASVKCSCSADRTLVAAS